MSSLSRQLCLLASLSLCAFSQEYRATIVGTVLDKSGAAVPKVTVSATRTGTNTTITTQTNDSGYYTLPFLIPDRYDIEYKADGFQALKRQGIVLQVNDRLNLSVELTIGSVTNEITVVGEQELINTATASRGLVFDPIKMQEIPLNGRQAFMLMRLSPGVIFSQRTFGATGFSGTRGWDVNGSFVMNGGRSGSNQFLLNGAPISTNGTFNMSPNVEAVSEMKVMVNTYDSQFGRSGGGHVNTTLKSGTNEWHGTLFNFWRNRILDANTRQNNALGVGRGFRNQHQYGGTVGGAIRKNKDFVFFSFEGWQERVPFPSNVSVPPTEIRGGDFSRFIPAGQTAPIQIYDPLTSQSCSAPGVACVAGGNYIRQPFPGNIIPANRISPIGRAIIGYYPAPNFQVNSLINNFTRPDNVGKYRYEQPMGRYDKIITDKDRLYVLFTFQDGSEFRNSNGFDPPAANGNMTGTVRRDFNIVASYDRVISPTKIFHVQANYNRFQENFPDVSDPTFTRDKIGITQLPTVDTFPTTLTPRINVDGFSNLFGNQFLNESSRQQINFQANMSETRGRHSIKYGIEIAQLLNHNRSAGRAGGEFTFGTQWTRQYFGISQGVRDGSGVASLLLGNIQSGFIAYNDTFLRRQPYFAGFFQDDWKVNNKLTLNLGLRWDVQFPLIEIQNRLNRGFDYVTPQANSNQIVARWRELNAAGAAIPNAPDAIRGGLNFAGVGNVPRRVYNFDLTNIQPRIGFAYSIDKKTVFRGGFGIFHRTDTRGNIANGFSLNTNYINSLDAGQTPSSARLTGPYSFQQPFPDGVVRPLGASLGLAAGFGGGISFDNPNRPSPRTRQWSLGFERQIGSSMVLDVSYVGSRTTQEGRGIQIGDMRQADWDRAQTDPNFFQQAVPNPFFGNAQPGTGLNSQANIARRDLLRQYPGFQGVFDNINPSGAVWYNALQVRFEKRLMGDRSKTGALIWTTAYTWSKQMENFLRNDYAFAWQEMRNQVTAEDRTHNLTNFILWDIPVGKGRAFGANLPKLANAAVGGWTISGTLIYQSGVPLGAYRGWEFRCGDPRAGVNVTETSWLFNDRSRFSECWRQLRPFEYAQMPNRLHQIRSQTAPTFDMTFQKKFNLTERMQLEFRAEAFNAFNTPLRGDPNTTNPAGADFGVLPVAQLNFPRNVQLGARFRF
jgi:hypothetical protein